MAFNHLNVKLLVRYFEKLVLEYLLDGYMIVE